MIYKHLQLKMDHKNLNHFFAKLFQQVDFKYDFMDRKEHFLLFWSVLIGHRL